MTGKTPKKPARASAGAARSATKAREAGKPYSPEQRAEALRLLESQGMAHAHKVTEVPKATLSRWAREAGVDLGEQARARTATATEAVRARAAQVQASTVELLEQHLAQAGDYLGTVAGVNALAARVIAGLDPEQVTRHATLGGFTYSTSDPTADELLKVAGLLDSLPLAVRDAEGMVTRAIHDLQLLKGEATERGELVVEFAVPRPVAVNPDSVPTIEVKE